MTDYIGTSVEKLLRKWEERDPFRLAKKMDIEILRLPLGEHLKGYFFYYSRIAIIVLNNSMSEALQRIICAHELGHAVLHKELARQNQFQEFSLFNSTIHTELEANQFAAELLIEDEALLSLLKEGFTVFEVASCLFVPPELVVFKLQMMKKKGISVQIPIEAAGNFLKKSALF